MHQCLIQWNGNDVEVVPADESCDVSMTEVQLWGSDEAECLSGRLEPEWSFVDLAKKEMTPVRAASGRF